LTQKQELIWQGEGVGYITKIEDKEKRINEFVAKILAQFRRNNKKQLLLKKWPTLRRLFLYPLYHKKTSHHSTTLNY
jgi:hypothetical protein